MLCAAWPYVRSDLASTRRAAAAFLDNLEENDGSASRRNWVARWTNIGDAHCRVGDLNFASGNFDDATDAWLCALTVFEVAKRLMDEDDPQRGDVSVKVEAAIQRIESLAQKVNRVQIACSDQSELLAYYLPAGGRDLCAPAVICISREDETGAALLGRLLPVAIGRSISILIVSHDDVKNRWRGQSEILLSCCLDYLSARPDVDTTRIGVYGEGLSAVLATDFAASDRRVAAAVCDGGLWNWVRTLASIGWMTKPAKALDDEVMPAYRSRLVRQLRCPILVLAGGRGTVSLSEAAKLQVDCTAAHIDLELATPRMGRPSLGEIENFVTIDDCIFEWLENKLARS
ncbi:hypothetical protein ACVMIH_007582 [Bradyrhizobium sp. USDA 4503]